MGSVIDKVRNHEQILIKYLEELAHKENTSLGAGPETYVIADTKNHQYQLTYMGWHERKYYFNVLMHFSIKPDGKIWLQQNNTEILIGPALEEKGVAKSDIVVGFRPEYLRAMTGYAVA